MSSFLMLGAIVLLGLPAAVVCLPWALITGDVRPLYQASLVVVRIGLRIGGIRIDVQGVENVPAGVACIFMPNHVSNLDPPVLLPLIPGRTSVFLKKSLMKIPILGSAMRLAEFVPVSRGGTVEGARESVRAAKAVLDKGLHITTFVEGTRSHDGRLLPFKKGPFYLALETGAPCIPISIWGTETMMGKGSMMIRPGTAHVVFHPPVWPEQVGCRDGLMLAVREAIESSLPAEMR